MEIMEFIIEKGFEGSYPEPISAHLSLPQWAKDDPNTLDRNIGGPATPKVNTYKRCVPFMDVMRSGYIIPLWVDLAFSYEECPSDCVMGDKCPGGSMKVEWPRGSGPGTGFTYSDGHIENRDWETWGNIPELATSLFHSSMTFLNPWIIKTPPGYSTLITSPFNDESHPHPSIKTLTGLVNTDTYHNQVTFFFHVKEPFNALLKKGTPLVQVIPIKREEWERKITYMTLGDENSTKWDQEKTYLASQYVDGYRNKHGCPVQFH